MHKLFSSSYDASVYLQQPDQNAGRDGLLEVGKLYYSDVKDIARSLIKFNMNPVSQSLYDNSVTGSWKCYLNLKTSVAEEIPLDYTLYANAVSQSWTMGTGTKFDNITTDGISWKYRDGINKWQDITLGGSATYIAGTTGSANAEGGTWYTASESSQSFSYQESDLRMDVTGIVNLWISGTIPNNGFIIHHSLNNEYNNTLDYGVIKFFSKETNTIYEPKLELVWNDSSYVVSGLSPVTGSLYDDDYKVVLTNFKTKYPKDSVVKIRLKGRDMYPSKSFGSTFQYDQVKYLPTGSTYYQLEDYVTREVIVPFGEYSKVSCDSNGNYFKLDLSTLPITRNYLVKIKVVEGGISTIIDNKFMFEIVE